MNGRANLRRVLGTKGGLSPDPRFCLSSWATSYGLKAALRSPVRPGVQSGVDTVWPYAKRHQTGCPERETARDGRSRSRGKRSFPFPPPRRLLSVLYSWESICGITGYGIAAAS